jgi:hypothetical protein
MTAAKMAQGFRFALQHEYRQTPTDIALCVRYKAQIQALNELTDRDEFDASTHRVA